MENKNLAPPKMMNVNSIVIFESKLKNSTVILANLKEYLEKVFLKRKKHFFMICHVYFQVQTSVSKEVLQTSTTLSESANGYIREDRIDVIVGTESNEIEFTSTTNMQINEIEVYVVVPENAVSSSTLLFNKSDNNISYTS